MRIDLTPAAQTWAATYVSIEALKQRVRDEVATITRENDTHVDIIFHSFWWAGGIRDGSQHFLLRPIDDGVAIDIANILKGDEKIEAEQ